MLCTRIAVIVCLALITKIAAGDYLDDIGLTDLRNRDASLDGSGVIVAQVEAIRNGNWQTNPAETGLNASQFTYFATTAPYPVGTTYNSDLESEHANRVGSLFFGVTTGTKGYDGISPDVNAIEMYETNYHANSIVNLQVNTEAPVINQSFVFLEQNDSTDEIYDDYAARYNRLFCNGIYTDGNNDPEITTLITSPASSYNCIAVGVVDDVNLTPLADGRSKPDIVAPSNGGLSFYTSYTTPIVSGAATLLIQSGARDDAGAGTASDATDIRTIKALLLNSATKPSGWSHAPTRPLDVINGAGILEINQAQLQLAAGKYSETVNDIVTDSGTTHLPPSGITNNVTSNTGWNLGTLTNTSTGNGANRTYYDSTDHYFFECDPAEASTFNLTATLVWNRNLNRTNINNLDLFLYQENGTLIASSVSTVDNVEHLYEIDLSPGRYVLQVHKPASGRDSTSETYALAFNFAAGAPLAADNATATATSTNSIALTWSDNSNNEDGFLIERRLSGGSYAEITNLAANTTSYGDTGLTDGTIYEYRITAFNGSGASTAATASDATLLAPPSSASTTTISDSEIQIQWTDNSASEDGYRIERRPPGGSYSQIATTTSNAESYDDSGLSANTGYDYRITAYNGTGDSTSIETSGSTFSLIEDWRLGYFGTIANSGDAADDFDFDYDSIVNLIEYATGSDPTTFSPNPLDASLLGSDGQVSFDWRVDNAYDFSLGYSSDLTAGFTYYGSATLDSDLSPELELIGTEGPVDGFETRTYGVRESVTDPSIFLRLLVN